MKVLVTGGAGYIGSHTCKCLREHGMTPIVYDNLSTGHAWAVQFGPFIEADLFNTSRLDEAFKVYQPKAVLHFASSINVRESMQNPGLYYRNNVFATLELLEAMRRHHVNYFIFSSTAAVYGHTSSEPLKENALCNPINVYGKSKWMVEKMMADYERAYDFKFVIFRYFNAAGADPEGKLGEAHEPETHLIPRAIRVALGLESCLKVFGNTYPTFDGTAIRDYIHVTDLAEAHIQALNYLIQGGSSVTLNLGTGRGYSLKQVLDMVEQISSIRLDTELNPPNLEEPPCLIANGDLASSLLRWKPIYSDLETIVSTAFNWHRSFSK